ncbi:hypothetical protein CF326_g7985 [Tilletia indica]|uniref:DUF1640 domain-containing protein n=1 Tax=Tilletia indica TaxID=43049 RepID=A0A177TRS4_9BASI|nr:hypothetical protein CF326_g7985 [Tilletia indica]KAE8259720.1 hypothetical protein A4X13_0g809 [Tilletia indica]
MNTVRNPASSALMRAVAQSSVVGRTQAPAAHVLVASRPSQQISHPSIRTLSTSTRFPQEATRRTASSSLLAFSIPALALLRDGRPAPSSRSPSSSHFHSSAIRPYHFDTHHFVRRLQESGMERPHAEALVEALADVIDESIRNLSEGMVAREEGEKWRYTQKVDFARLKSEIQLLERNDFVLMKTENERLMADVEKLKQRLREEITRTTAGVRLDLNLEKGRIRDESSVHALKIKEVDTRIETEIAGLRTSIQSAKFNVLQYLVGVATGAGALLLAYLRMFK